MSACSMVGFAMMIIGFFAIMNNEEAGIWVMIVGAILMWIFGA